jgi:hypothetical protein
LSQVVDCAAEGVNSYPSASQSLLGEGLHDTASRVPSEPFAGKGTDSTEKLVPFHLAANGMFVFALSA